MSACLLTPYWIESPYQRGPFGFGVTAHSLEDAARIIRGWRFDFPDDLSTLKVRQNVCVADLDQRNVVPRMGPIAVRGLWYPFARVGIPEWMEV
jgi:hypothetical protein